MTFGIGRRVLLASIGVLCALHFAVVPRAFAALEDDYAQINGESGTAQGIIFAGICPGVDEDGEAHCTACRDYGNCTLDDVLQVFVNLATFILGISGSVLFFIFMYGGWKWLFSRGNAKWVEQGRDVMTGGIIGLLIVFGAYVAINFIVGGLTGADSTNIGTDVLENSATQGLTPDEQATVPDVFITE